MRIDVNPFYARASEYIGTGLKFLQLFSPEILKVFDEKNIWSSINIIRSSPGGGKTTLLKTFTPEILTSIVDHIEKADNIKKIYKELCRLNVLDSDKNLKIISTLLPISNEYSLLNHLDIADTHKYRIFNSLLNSRISVSVLRAICQVKKLSFPNDLDKIIIDDNTSIILPNQVAKIHNGKQLYDWASNLEEEICTTLDSVFPSEVKSISGHDDLFILQLLDNKNLSIGNRNIDEQILLMFDDVHNLSNSQRDILFLNLLRKRPPINIWISERTEALSLQEIYSDKDSFIGHKSRREYNVIDLEEYWRSGKKFERFCESVSNIRIYEASEKDIDQFSGCLNDSFEKNYIEDRMRQPYLEIKERVETTFFHNKKYRPWINEKLGIDGNYLELLREWRTLEILLYRDLFKKQQSLEFELSKEELEENDKSDVRNAADLFLNKEFKVPYYFGFSKISNTASNNIEQFLSFAGELYEEVVSRSVVNFEKDNYKIRITPERQEQIIKKIVSETWNDFEIRIPKFNQLKLFLNSLGKICQRETFQKNAPISPGVTGFAISMGHEKSDWTKLKEIVAKNNTSNPYYRIAELIGIGISHNIFESRPNYKCKGKTWMVLYLNRLLCVKYNLTLNYGGFREKKISELVSWLNDNFEPEKNLWDQK